MVNVKFLNLLFVAGCIFLSNHAYAETEKLFASVDEKVLSTGAAKKVAEIKARNKSKTSGLFKFKISVLEAKSFVLNLPDGRTVTMKRKFLTKNPTHLSYAASSEEEQVHLTLVTSGTTVSGTVYTQFSVHSIDSVGDDGIYLISAIDPSTVPKSEPRERVMAPPIMKQREKEYQEEKKKNQDRSTDKSQSLSPIGQNVSAAAAGAINVDLMVQYTSSARSYGGGNDVTIASDIRNAVAQANLSFSNSGINVQLNLVDLGFTPFNESGKNLEQSLQGWANRPEVGLRRNQVAADAVMVIVSPVGTGCGDTYTNLTLQPQPGNAYSTINIACLKSGDPILAHELGHVFAADHNIGASQAPVIASGSAHGWPGTNDTNATKVYNGSTWYACQHTMMAYPSTNPACTTQRMLYWSNPAKAISWYYNGTSVQSNWYIGSSTANNFAHVTFAAPTVSAFRGPAGGGPGSGAGGGSGSEGAATQSIFTMISRLLDGW